MRIFNKTVLAMALACLTAPVFADDAPAAPAPAAAPAAPTAPTLADVLTASNIAITGYVDTGYTNIDSTGLFANGTATRVFDAPGASTAHNFSSFNLNQAALTVAMQPKEGFGGLVNVTGGQDAEVIASYGEGLGTQRSYDLTQAYGSYTGGPLTVIAGKFATLAGAEVIASPSDTNYSRSILFGYAIPFTHTGLRGTYVASDTMTLILGLNNGWDQVTGLTSKKTVEAGIIATPSKTFTLAGTYYGGDELTSAPFAGGVNGMRNLFDVVATLNATSQLTFILNYDYANQDNATLPDGSIGKATWDGFAAYANYQITDMWRLSLRGEYFDDKDGFRTGIVQKWKEGTVTLAYIPTAHVELRGELRMDKSDQSVFLKDSGGASDTQTSEALEAIYKF